MTSPLLRSCTWVVPSAGLSKETQSWVGHLALFGHLDRLWTTCSGPRQYQTRRRDARDVHAVDVARQNTRWRLGWNGIAVCSLAFLRVRRAGASDRRPWSRSSPRRVLAATRAEEEHEGPIAPQNIIFLVVFLHLLGFTMGGPILPSLRQHFHLEAAQTGLITSAFPLGMLGAVFVFPALSDRIGRKPILITSYLGVGTGFVLQAIALYYDLPFRAFLALRVASGACAGASTVVKAYLADTAAPEKLPTLMAYREAAGTLAFIVGPTLGGILFSLTGLPFVVLFSGLTSLISAALVILFLKSPPATGGLIPNHKNGSKGTRTSIDEVTGCPLGNPWPAVFTMMFVSFSYNLGQSFFDGFFSLLAAERFGLEPARLGPMLTGVACLVFLNSACMYGKVVRRFGIVVTGVFGLCAIASGLALVGECNSLWTMAAALALYAFGVPIFTPSVPTILTQCAPPKRRGFVLGVDSAVNSVGRILSPVLMGLLYQVNPVRAFRSAGLAVFLGAIVMMLQRATLREWYQ